MLDAESKGVKETQEMKSEIREAACEGQELNLSTVSNTQKEARFRLDEVGTGFVGGVTAK